jgi:PPIC-type peptidyl-prolyl cis-trans isomerase-like protein
MRMNWTGISFACLLGACSPSTPSAARESLGPALAPEAPARSTAQTESPYPPGRWRRDRDALRRLVLWPSHILIRFADAPEQADVSFTLVSFHSVLPPATRTRGEALELARDIVRRARAEPDRFAELAGEYSEDIVRRERGGSLGGIQAKQLSLWPTVLDALLAIAPGEVSDVVETRYGFHVFTRQAPPARQTVTGRRIVIGHERAPWLGTLDASAAPRRTREAALELARALFEQARAAPDRFLELVTQHSELRDKAVGGDFGTWSNVEPSAFPREIEVLAHLSVGEVAPPFDSLFGVQIVQRVPDPERTEYAMEGIHLRFDPNAPEPDPTSRSSVLTRARTLNQRLLASPALLPELQKEYVPFKAQWTEGRGSPELLAELASVEPGEFLRQPVRSVSSYFVGRRIASGPVATVDAVFDLP